MIFRFLFPQVPVFQIKYYEKYLELNAEKNCTETYRKLGYGRNVLTWIVLKSFHERIKSFHLRDFYIDWDLVLKKETYQSCD